VRTKPQLLKSASTLKEFSAKIKSAQIGETLTPETVQEIAMEIAEVAEVAGELAAEIAEGVPAEETSVMDRGRDREEPSAEPEQIETAQEDEEDDKDKLKEQVASLNQELIQIKREATLAKLAPKYANLFPKKFHDAKLNEILTSKESLNILEAKVEEAHSIFTNKSMVKVASMPDSLYDLDDLESEEVNIASKM